MLVGVLAAAAAVVLLGPQIALSQRLEGDVRRDLRAREARVRITASPLGAAQGRLARLSLHARDAAVDGTSIDEVRIDLSDVRIDAGRAVRGDLVVQHVARGSAVLVVGEESLRRYLAEGRGFRNAGVRMDGGVVTITGQVTVLNAIVDVILRATLVVRDGRHLALDVQELRVSGLEVPPDVGNALAASVNPLLTAPQQPVPLRLTHVTLDGGVARLTGEVVP